MMAGGKHLIVGEAPTIVNHGSDASVARPNGATTVLWIGTVQPTNMTTADLWVGPATTAPGQVTGLTATSKSASALLAWTAPASTGGSVLTDYLIEYRTTAGPGSWTTFSHSPSTATSITVTGLTNGVSYDFRVSAINAIGTGIASATASATPAPLTKSIISVATTNDGVTSGTSRTFNLPTTVAAGDILVLLIAQGQPGSYAWSATDWTSQFVGQPDETVQVLTKVANGSEAGGTVTGTFNVAPGIAVIGTCYTLRNVSATAVATGVSTSVFGTTAAIPAGLGALPAGVIVIGCAAKGGTTSTSTPPSGWTEDFEPVGAIGGHSFNVASIVSTAGGTLSGNWTWSANAGNGSAVAVAFT